MAFWQAIPARIARAVLLSRLTGEGIGLRGVDDGGLALMQTVLTPGPSPVERARGEDATDAGRNRRGHARTRPVRRSGAATVDYVLILAVIMPLVLMSIVASRQIMGLAFEFLCVLVSWPFM